MKRRIPCLIGFVVVLICVGRESSVGQAWVTFQPPNEKIRCLLPVQPQEENSNDKQYRKYFLRTGLSEVTIFSGPGLGETETFRTYALQYEPKAQTIKFGSASGEKYSVIDSDGYYSDIVLIQGSDRSYVFHAYRYGIKDDSDVQRILSTLAFNGVLSGELKNRVVKSASAGKKKNAVPNDKGDSTDGTVTLSSGGLGTGGLGTGNGQGYGTGRGEAPKTTSPATSTLPTPSTTVLLKVLSKPRASYTDLARIYEIQGIVRVRVVFGADGTIKSATPLNRLPWGLTGNAVKAAYAIKFEPQQLDGKPVNVSKLVEYSFTIY